ncbi:MAG TPA: hypothetical protein VFD94_03735, partial [Jatrophihabitans sp.]|nr:hypothetical protein [Jatrophihabitans sp.]
MRPLTLSVAALLSCAVLAGCASRTGSAGQAGSDPAGNPGSTSSQSPSGSSPSSSSPSGAPGTAVPVSGPVSLSVLSLTGPLEPPGPYLGTSVEAILKQMSTALGGKQPTCLAAGCWTDARVPAGSLLLAVRPDVTSCNQ